MSFALRVIPRLETSLAVCRGEHIPNPRNHSTLDLDFFEIDNMCFDDRDTYTTRAYVRNGVRYEEEYTRPRHGMSWRRKYGLGGLYYPSRYYTRRPLGRFTTNAHVQPYGYPGYGDCPRGVMRGGYAGYSSGYGRYFPDNRVAMPRHAAMVSALSGFCLSRLLYLATSYHTPPASQQVVCTASWTRDSA